MKTVHVECYSGSRYAERPIAMHWQGQRLEIRQVLYGWRSPDGPAFDVLVAGDRRLRLELDENSDCWSVTEYRSYQPRFQEAFPCKAAFQRGWNRCHRPGSASFSTSPRRCKDVISSGIGEPDFVTPDVILQAGIASLQHGETRYTSNSGTAELRRAISNNLETLYGVHYDPESEILVTVGVSEALYLAMTALLDPGDEVIVPQPCFVAYTAEVTFAGGEPVTIPTRFENAFQVTGAEIEAAITPRTKALLIGYPNNPTGAVLSRQRLEEIAHVAEKHDLVVLSDEIYDRLVYGRSPARLLCRLAGYEGAHDPPGRPEQELCHDRLAHRLCLRAQGSARGHAQGAPVHDHVRAHHRPGRGRGGPDRSARRRGRSGHAR